VIEVLKPLIQQFMPFAQQKMGFSRPPRLFLRQDRQNAANPMGKTGFYDPQNESITLYISGRHPKDIMRSLAHELQHHTQKCNGDFDNVTSMGEQGYAQADPHMRSMEIEAYQASIVFRDWEDSLKETIYYEHLQKGDKSSMSTKNWKNRELNGLLMERFGFDFKPLAENLDENENQIFAPNHYCVHHGGVQHNGSIQMAEAVGHNYNKKLNRVTHYDMKLSDGTILENVAAEDIQVTDASLAEGHGGHMAGKRDDGQKPDYIDIDGDGDKEEPMKKAAKDKKVQEEGEDMGYDAHKKVAKRDYDLEEGGGAGRSDPTRLQSRDQARDLPDRKRPMEESEDDNRLQEVVRKLHNAGYSPKQIKESLTSAFNKAKKG
tara:strand:+ start:46 stop:1173 length:1128 start_codon:yes stop_codon:yes gene_type:complete